MRTLLLILALACVALMPARLAAQALLSGTVLDADTGGPLPGATVLVQGTSLGTITDGDGRFDLSFDFSAGAGHTLVVSFVGYGTVVVDPAAEARPFVVRLAPRLVDLQPVVVSASRTEEARTAAPVAVAALSAEQLRAQRPAALHEALNTVPGVHMVNLGNEQHAMSIRQPLSYKALFAYLEDGIPVRPTGIFNHNALIEVNMAAVERIEVVRGPSSALYGAGAVGGAVNFITPRPSGAPAGGAGLRTDTYGYRRADVFASGTKGRLGVWAGGYVARQRDGWAEHTDFDKHALTLRADYAFAPATRLSTTLSTNHLDTDTNGSLDSLNFFGHGYSSLHTFTYRRVAATRLTARLAHVWSPRHATDVAVFARRNAVGQLPHYRVRNVQADPSRAAGEVNEDRFRSVGFHVQHTVYLRASRLVAGAGVDRSPNAYVARYVDVARDAATGRYVGFTRRDSLLTDYEVDLLNAGAYVQYEVSPLARLRLVGALRYDRIAYGFDNHLPASAFSGAPDARNGFGRFSPRFGATYDLGGGRGLYANYSRGFVPPEAGELYRGVKVPYLQPATFDSYETGGWAAFADGRLQADASVYRMDGVDEIISVRLDDGTSTNANAGRTRHAGVEYGLAVVPHRSISVRLGGTVARHTFVRHEEGGSRMDGHRMDAAPGWIANAELAYRPPVLPGSRLGLEWQHVGPYYMDARNTVRYAGYDVLHLRAGYTVRGVELWMNVLNLTDAHYANIASKSRSGHQYNPGTPRSLTFGAGYRFGHLR